MPEIRQNRITREWVIIATERARRPEEFAKKTKEKKEIPKLVPTCPFCPGNEDKTPPETLRLNGKNGWQVRVTPNKFAAVSTEGELVRTWRGIKRTLSGVGHHEVIVETPDHSLTTALLTDEEVGLIIESYRRRYRDVMADSRIEQVTLFKNHGESAGTSLEHPHSQLIALPVIPVQVRDRLEEALRHYDEFGECIFCRVMDEEIEEGARVVLENEHFVAFVPFAAMSPFHMWIFPKKHMATFEEINDAQAADLARILRRVLRKLYNGLDNPDFNYTLRTAPKESEHIRYYHWYVSVIPRLTKMAGFELGSGMFINTALPEESAKFLRNVKVD